MMRHIAAARPQGQGLVAGCITVLTLPRTLFKEGILIPVTYMDIRSHF